MSIKYMTELDSWRDLDDLLWSGARDRWKDATDDQKEAVWDRLEEFFYDGAESLTAINDVIWFECDDIFFPDESDDEDMYESAKRKKLARRLERLERLVKSRNK